VQNLGSHFFPRKRPRRLEDELQRSIVAHLQWRAPKDLFFWHHPAGGKRSPVEAAVMVGLGTKRGLPDLLFLHQGKLFGLELKAAGHGRVTSIQSQVHEEMRAAGATIEVAFGIDQALAVLEGWGLLKRNVANQSFKPPGILP
jgi:hypothetical protein